MSDVDLFHRALASGSTESANRLLQRNSELANSRIAWGPDNKNLTDPLHFISDCVFNGLLSDDAAAELAKSLIDHGALINGSAGAESPLIGAASLSSISVANVLIEHGADIERVALFGATALHWAAYVGTPTVVDALLNKGAIHDVKCSEFGATPLFWAVQGFSKYGPPEKSDQIGAAKILISHGANIRTMNNERVTAIERSQESDSEAMTRVLENHVNDC